MGQEPKIELTAEDLPRAVPEPAPARRWSATRPGDIHAPADVPWGGGFHTPGPDTGYAYKLAADADLTIDEDEDRGNVETMLVLIMSARASLFGKAPEFYFVAGLLIMAGLGGREGLPEAVLAQLAERRRYWAPRVANSKSQARALVGRLEQAMLRLSVEDLRHRLALGEVALAP